MNSMKMHACSMYSMKIVVEEKRKETHYTSPGQWNGMHMGHVGSQLTAHVHCI